MWDHLSKQGVFLAIQNMRRRYDEDKKRLRAERKAKGEAKDSERAMADTDRFSKQTSTEREQQRQRGEENLRRKAETESKDSGRPVEEVVTELRSRTEDRPYLVEEDDSRGAPFYRVEQLGGQKVIYLNRTHPFYTKVYKGQDTSSRVRSALEIVLLVFGTCELEASTDERQRFYKQERTEWSNRLELALESLETYASEEGSGSSADREGDTSAA